VTSAFEPVPRTIEELLEPTWLAWALDDIAVDDEIISVERFGDSKTIAEKVRFTVTVTDREGGSRTRSYCVKGHFDGGPDTLRPEAHFYGELAPRVGVRTPRAYYTGIDVSTGRALVVMDDVISIGGHFLDAHQPYPVETVRSSLDQLAVLHAATWDDPVPAGCDWLRPKMTDMAARFPADALQSLLDDGRADGLPVELRDGERLHAALLATAALPHTSVIHGDTHSGNVYLDADGRACWLDWQVIQPGYWAVDVAYHLSTVLDIDMRRAHEVELLRWYLDRLAAHGGQPPDWDDAWEAYTSGFAHGYFLWTITRISSRAVVLIHVPRIGAALSDHDTFRRLGV
jgi:Phosphotransferase enzyme family